MRHSRFLRPLAAVMLVTVVGCFNPFRPEVSSERVVQTTGAAPQPTSSRNVMKLFRWCWENQNIVEYEKIFTDDFRFKFAETDSQGREFIGGELIREEEIDIARHLFVGRPGEPPANSISFTYGDPLIPDVDTRPGKTAPSHVKFESDVDITIRTDASAFRIVSRAAFYAVVWDSANIAVMRARLNIPENRRRWFIERYEEMEPSSIVYNPTDELRTRPSRWERILDAAPGGPQERDARTADELSPPGAGLRWLGLAADRIAPPPEAAETETRQVTWGWIKARYH